MFVYVRNAEELAESEIIPHHGCGIKLQYFCNIPQVRKWHFQKLLALLGPGQISMISLHFC